MKTILHIIRKEFIQFRRDKKMFGLSFVAPVFQLLILGYAANLDVTEIPLIICDQDNSQESRSLAANFTNTGYFKNVGYVGQTDEIDHFLDDGHASFALVIPRGFGTRLAAGESTPLQLIADGSETTAGGIGVSYASIIISRFSQDILLETLQRRGVSRLPARVGVEARVWYNPELKSRNFMVPSVLGLLLMVLTMILTSLAIVKEKELGTLEQLIVTPIRSHQLILGKIAPFLIIGLIDVVLVVGVARFFFGLELKGDFWLLFLLNIVFLMTTLGLGLFVSTMANTQQQAMMTSIFFIMLPMMFFSGFVFPIENMPGIIQGVSYFMPLRYFFVIVRGLFLKGVGLDVLWPQGLALFGFGVIILSLSVAKFRKRLS